MPKNYVFSPGKYTRTVSKIEITWTDLATGVLQCTEGTSISDVNGNVYPKSVSDRTLRIEVPSTAWNETVPVLNIKNGLQRPGRTISKKDVMLFLRTLNILAQQEKDPTANYVSKRLGTPFKYISHQLMKFKSPLEVSIVGKECLAMPVEDNTVFIIDDTTKIPYELTTDSGSAVVYLINETTGLPTNKKMSVEDGLIGLFSLVRAAQIAQDVIEDTPPPAPEVSP